MGGRMYYGLKLKEENGYLHISKAGILGSKITDKDLSAKCSGRKVIVEESVTKKYTHIVPFVHIHAQEVYVKRTLSKNGYKTKYLCLVKKAYVNGLVTYDSGVPMHLR